MNSTTQKDLKTAYCYHQTDSKIALAANSVGCFQTEKTIACLAVSFQVACFRRRHQTVRMTISMMMVLRKETKTACRHRLILQKVRNFAFQVKNRMVN